MDLDETNPRWEPYTADFIEAVRGALVFVDAGAEFGFYIQLALAHGLPALRVIAFEPDSTRALSLRRQFTTSIELHQSALWDSAEWRSFKRAGPGLSGSLVADGNVVELVRCVDGDSVLRTVDVDVLKMDVEGAECKALRGLKATIERCRPALFIEFHPPLDDEDAAERAALARRLTRLGYRLDETAEARIAWGGHVVLQ